MSFFPVIYSTLGAYTILNSDFLTRIIGITLNSLTNSITILAASTLSNSNTKLKEYMDELELLDIEIKLKIVDNWLKGFNIDTIEAESSIDVIYRGVSDSCHNIYYLMNDVNKKMVNYNNMWFKSWRTIDLDFEINKLKRYTKILQGRINLIPMSGINQIRTTPNNKLEYSNINDFYNMTTELKTLSIPGEQY